MFSNSLSTLASTSFAAVLALSSIFNEENHGNCEFFLREFSGANKISELNILPTEYNDGFYYCVLGKK